MKIKKGSITNVRGITAVGKNIGIRKTKRDFALIYSDKICNAAAVYTSNFVKGAPLIVTKNHLKDGKAQAIVINSGIANVCTGEKGIENAAQTTRWMSQELGIKTKDVLVASTGIIGKYLPMDIIQKGIVGIKNELSKKSHVAEAILTTDLVKKEICVQEENFTIAAIAKGSGMIHPNMATMLSFICTDAEISSEKLNNMLKKAVDKSFNMMTVDRDTSTSDMCIILANGYADKINEQKFQDALDFVCQNLAKKIAADGEGATKLFVVKVINAKEEKSAKLIAKSIASSNLLKCAIYGGDPNWGRILCAMGNSQTIFTSNKIDIYFDTEMIVKNGVEYRFDYKKIKKIMSKKELIITIDLHDGGANAEAYGCDMTEEYIKINAHYHT